MASKSTIISLVPFELNESKPGLYPGAYKIPAAKENDFELFVVTDAVHYVYLDMDRGSISVPTVSAEVARSICEDYKISKLGFVAGEAEPGLDYVEGEYKDKKSVLAVAKDKIERMMALQKQWFIQLVEIADDEWSKYHSHKSVSDIQRYAAKFLGLEREWNVEGTAESNTFCPACRSVVMVGAVVCGACRTIIKPEEYKKFGFQTAGA